MSNICQQSVADALFLRQNQRAFMKYLSFLLIVLIFACNNSDNTAQQAPVAVSEEQSLKALVEKYPDSSVLVETLVQYYRDVSSYEKAISLADQQVIKDSTNTRWWDIKGTLQFENNDTIGAIHAFEKAADLVADPQYIISLGTLYAQTKDARALVMADALLQSKAAAEKESYFIKGLYYSYSNEKEKAIGFFDKCLQISYTYMSAYTEKALALYDLKKYPEALAVVDKGITLQNNYDEGYYYRGRILEKLGRTPEAIEAYQSALMYDPGYIEAKDALAKLGIKQQ